MCGARSRSQTLLHRRAVGAEVFRGGPWPRGVAQREKKERDAFWGAPLLEAPAPGLPERTASGKAVFNVEYRSLNSKSADSWHFGSILKKTSLYDTPGFPADNMTDRARDRLGSRRRYASAPV